MNKRCEEYLGPRNETLKLQAYQEYMALEQARERNARLSQELRGLEARELVLQEQSKRLTDKFSIAKYKYCQLVKQGAPRFPFVQNADDLDLGAGRESAFQTQKSE